MPNENAGQFSGKPRIAVDSKSENKDFHPSRSSTSADTSSLSDKR